MNKIAQKRIDDMTAKHDKARADLDRELIVLKALPDDLPEPAYIHTSAKLYGCDARIKYGDAYGSNGKYELADAVALVKSIGEIVEFHTVKSGCLAMKPADQISEDEMDRATVKGPYGCKIVSEQYGVHLSAFVLLSSGQRVTVSVALVRGNSYGYWSRIPGVGRTDRPGEHRYTKQFANIGQARTVSYGGGAHSGDGSKGQMVYVFHGLDDIMLLD